MHRACSGLRHGVRSRHAFERHFDPTTARVLDALVEGLTIHSALDTESHDPRDLARAVQIVTRAVADTGGAPA